MLSYILKRLLLTLPTLLMVALAVFSPLLDLIHALGVWLTGSGDVVTQLVLFHTLFNLLGVLLMWPLSGPLVQFLLARFTTADEDAARPRYLDRNVAAVPVLALQALRPLSLLPP